MTVSGILVLPGIVMVVLRKSSGVIALDRSLAEKIDTLSGLTSKLTSAGIVEGKAKAVSVSTASSVVGKVELTDSEESVVDGVVESIARLVTPDSIERGSGASSFAKSPGVVLVEEASLEVSVGDGVEVIANGVVGACVLNVVIVGVEVYLTVVDSGGLDLEPKDAPPGFGDVKS
jgi:hypothetical protein